MKSWNQLKSDVSTDKLHKLPYTPEWLASWIDQYIARKNIQRSNSFRISNKNIYILPSKAGWLFIASLLAILSGAINYNNSMAYLLCFFLSSLCFVAMIMTHKNLKNIIIYARPSASTFPGKQFEYHFSVRSADQKAHFSIQIDKENVSVDQNNEAEFTVTEKALNRGRQNPSRFKIYSEFPLGLFHAWSQVLINNSVIVYPAPLHYQALHFSSTGQTQQKQHDHGDDEFSGIREFIKGDNLRSLAWKTIARTHRLYTKEFHSEASEILIFDFDKIPDTFSIEEKLSILCNLIIKASEQQLQYGLKLPGKIITPEHSNSHLHECLTALALF